MKSKKEYLWRKYKKAKTEDEKKKIFAQITNISEEIKKINYELDLIEDIESRIPKMKEELQKTEENQRERNLKRKERYR